MAKVKKATKAFQKKHLKRELERRKKHKDIKKKYNSKPGKGNNGRPQQTTRDRDQHSDDNDDSGSNNESGSEIGEGGFSDSDASDSGAPATAPAGPAQQQRKKAAAAATASSKSKVDEGSASHRAQLDELKETDPEFYKFLQENDEDLLNFDDGEGLEDDDEQGSDAEAGDEDAEIDGQNEDDEEEGGQEKGANGEEGEEEDDEGETLTDEILDNWEKTLEKTKSLKLVRKMLQALKSAEQFTEGEGDDSAEYRFDDQAVVTRLISICVTEIPPVLDHYLPIKKPAAGKGREPLPSTSPRWSKVQPTVKSYLNHVLKVSKLFPDPKLQHFILRNFIPILPYFACFPNLSRDLLRRLIDVWTGSDDKARVSAFLALRKLATFSTTLLTLVMKKTYLSFVNIAANTNTHTWTQINFARDCVAELYSLNAMAAYQHAFVYIRQLAVTLRTAITTRTKDAYKAVYNWQFVHCLRLWSKVLSSHPAAVAKGSKSPLADLVYPFTQITLGACRLLSSPQYIPLRFHCIRVLLDLSEATGVYIPVVPYLVEVLDSGEVTDRAKPSTMKPVDFRVTLKAQKPYLHTVVYQDGLIQELLYLLLRFYAIHGKSIAFPELATPLIIHLKRLAKKTRNPKLSKQAKTLVEKLEQNSKFIEEQRSKVDFAPTDIAKAESFLADMNANAVPVIRHYDSVNKMKARVEQTGGPAEVDVSRKRKSEEGDREPKKIKKVAKDGKPKKLVTVVDDNADDEEDVVEDFQL